MSGGLLCRVEDLERTGAKGVTIGLPPRMRDLVVVRDGDEVRAYENSCPHLRMPLEILADHFLDEARENLVCRTHGARFAIRDGYCISGPCHGAWLRAVPIRVVDGRVWLAD